MNCDEEDLMMKDNNIMIYRDREADYGLFIKVFHGEFYDVYVHPDDSFYLPERDRASLEARANFYKLYGKDDEQYEMLFIEKPGINPVLEHMLGLPFEVMREKDAEGNEYTKDLQAIMNSIRYRKDIIREDPRFSLGYISAGSSEYKETINHFIEKGFYVLEVLKILHLGDQYPKPIPFYINDDVLDPAYKDTSHIADKIVVYSSQHDIIINQEEYLQYYLPFNNLSWTEIWLKLIDLIEQGKDGIRTLNPSREERIQRQLISSLRLCFEEILTAEFQKFLSYKRLPFSDIFRCVPDCELFCMHDEYYRSISHGAALDMIATTEMKYIDSEEGVKRKERRTYHFYKSDLIYLEQNFDRIKACCIRNKKNANDRIIPSVFISLLGLPYHALEDVEFFDFDNGTKEQFVSIYAKKAISDSKCLQRDYYEILLDRKLYDNFRFFINLKKCFFEDFTITNRYFFASQPIYTADRTENSLWVYELNTYFFRSEKFAALFTRGLIEGEITKICTEIQMAEDGKRIDAKKLFNNFLQFTSFLNQGYRSDEAYLACDQDVRYYTIDLYNILLVNCFNTLSKSKSFKSYKRAISADNKDRTYMMYDPSLKYPYILKGREYLAYKASLKDDIIHVDSRSLFSLQNRSMLNNNFGLDPAAIAAFESDDLGLPRKNNNPLENLMAGKKLIVEDSISLFNKKHVEILKRDIMLRDVLETQDFMSPEVCPFQNLDETGDFKILPQHIYDVYDRDLGDLFIFVTCIYDHVPFYFADLGEREYTKKQEAQIFSMIYDYATSSSEEFGSPDLRKTFDQNLLRAASTASENCIFDLDFFSSFNIIYKNNEFIALGKTFCAYSADGSKFLFEREDIHRLAILLNRLRAVDYFPKKKLKTAFVTVQSGVPYTLMVKLQKYLSKLKNNDVVTDESLIELFGGYTETIHDMSDLPYPKAFFITMKGSVNNINSSSAFRREMLNSGLYYYPEQFFFDAEGVRTHPSLSPVQKEYHLHDRVLLIPEFLTDLQSFLHPSQHLFHTLLKDFFERCFDYPAQKVTEGKIALLALYDKRPDFIADFISDQQEYNDPFRHRQDRKKLMEYIPEEASSRMKSASEMIELLIAFSLYVLDSIKSIKAKLYLKDK